MGNDILCIYALYEKDDVYKNNIEHFLKHGYTTDIDFLIVINGETKVEIPKRENITIVKRQNQGFDFGAYSMVLNSPSFQYIYDKYKYFIFINTSVRGPFYSIPNEWYKPFLSKINEHTKLVGTTINICTMDFPYLASMGFTKPFTHVQSMVFAMDKECLMYLKPFVFNVSTTVRRIDEVIEKCEVAMSQYVLQNNWNIDCIALRYSGIDYRLPHINFNRSSYGYGGDPLFQNAYFGKTVDKYELIFIKTNRDIYEGFAHSSCVLELSWLIVGLLLCFLTLKTHKA